MHVFYRRTLEDLKKAKLTKQQEVRACIRPIVSAIRQAQIIIIIIYNLYVQYLLYSLKVLHFLLIFVIFLPLIAHLVGFISDNKNFVSVTFLTFCVGKSLCSRLIDFL